MGLIYYNLCTVHFLSNLLAINLSDMLLILLIKIFGYTENRTLVCWVRSGNATSVICPTPPLQYQTLISKLWLGFTMIECVMLYPGYSSQMNQGVFLCRTSFSRSRHHLIECKMSSRLHTFLLQEISGRSTCPCYLPYPFTTFERLDNSLLSTLSFFLTKAT